MLPVDEKVYVTVSKSIEVSINPQPDGRQVPLV